MSGSKSSDASFAQAAPRVPEVRADQPLGLTVHSLPQADEAAADVQQRSRSGRFKMLAVLAVCAAPVIASYFTYYVIRPEGGRNFGELIAPQRDMPKLAQVQRLDGVSEPLDTLRGQWLLVSVAPAGCDTACRDRLYLQRQLREGLGKEKDRLDWVWLVNDNAPIAAEIAPGLQQATVRRIDAGQLASWLSPAAGHQVSEHLYVVDPFGHWMLRFPANMDRQSAAKAKRDLERLMRASSSWDKPGRGSFD